MNAVLAEAECPRAASRRDIAVVLQKNKKRIQ